MITSKQRAFLRSLANQIDTILMIGKDGMSADILKQADSALTARELIKGKVLETAGLTAREAAAAVAEPLHADVVQVIGSKFVLYRRNLKEPKIICQSPQGGNGSLPVQEASMEKLAVFGGTFNPIHNGHIHLIQGFCSSIGFDRVLLIPARVPPHKSVPDLAAAEHRLAMCRLAAEPHGFQVSDLELHRQGPSYTVDTLSALHRQSPNAQLYLIMGADMFLTLTSWHHSRQLLQLAQICAAPRDNDSRQSLLKYAEQLRPFGAKVHIADLPLLPISSTIIRQRVQEGLSLSGFVPQSVEDYIGQHHLYGGV